MKILFVAPMPMIPHIGGIQRVTDVLAKEFLREGHEVEYLCYFYDCVYDACKLPAYQHCIEYVPDYEHVFIERYLTLIEKKQYECIIFQWVDKYVNLWLHATPKCFKVISTVHQQPYPNRGYERIVAKNSYPKKLKLKFWNVIGVLFPVVHRRFLDRNWNNHLMNLSKNSDKVCLLSNSFIPRVLKYTHGINESKLCGINNPSTFLNEEEVDFSKKENIVLFVGRITNAQKNVTGFIDVWAQFNEQMPEWRAVILGDGPDMEICKRHANKLKVRNLEFKGYSTHVQDYFRIAKIQCITSFWEGFSMVLLEGMSYGCIPCVYDTYETLYDIVDDKKNGYISKAFDKHEMVKSMLEIAKDKSNYENMAQNAIIKSKKFDVTKIVGNWIELIESINK